MTKRKLIVAIIIEAICIPLAFYGWQLEKQGTTTTSIMMLLIPALLAITVLIGCVKAVCGDLGDKIRKWLKK